MGEIEKPRVLFVCRRGRSSLQFKNMFSGYLQSRGMAGEFTLESGGILDEDLESRIDKSDFVVGIYPEVISKLHELVGREKREGRAARLHEIDVANLKPDWNARLLEELIGE